MICRVNIVAFDRCLRIVSMAEERAEGMTNDLCRNLCELGRIHSNHRSVCMSLEVERLGICKAL
jgi:hypothetical protein